MREFTNGLSPAEAERLALLAEEMGEAIQVVGKILRHGYDSRNPLDRDAVINRGLLEEELGHVLAAMRLLMDSFDVNEEYVGELRELKLSAVRGWLHHQPDAALAENHGPRQQNKKAQE